MPRKKSTDKRVTSMRISEYTAAQIEQLEELRQATKSEIMMMAVDRMYRQDFPDRKNPMNYQQETQNMNSDQIYINRVQAVADCFDALLRGVDTPTIVQEEDGTVSYIPGAYLNDISYTGSRQVVWSIHHANDLGDWNIEDEAQREEMASWVAAQHDWEVIENE